VSARLAGDFSRLGVSGPASVGQANGSVWCVAEGRIDGLSELASDLGLDPATPAEAVLAAAFSRQGEAMLDQLGGRFALIVWDGANETGLLAVDQLGSRSLFFHDNGGARLHFATEVRELVKLLPQEPGPDESAVVSWFTSGTLEPDQTVFAGVRRLSGGCHLRLANGRWSLHRHWSPRFATPERVTLEAAGLSVRKELERSVGERCAGQATGVLLSGGLDSTSVAAVAAGLGVTRLRAYSALFPADASADESEFVALATQGLGVPAVQQATVAGGVLDASAEHVRDWRLPAASPNLFFQRPLLERVRADGATIVLDGQGGDELFACSPYLLADLLRGLRLKSLHARSRELAGGDPRGARAVRRTFALRGAAPRWLRAAYFRLHRRPALHWLTPRAVALTTDARAPWLTLDGPRWWTWLADTLTAGRERMGAHDHFRRQLAPEQLTGAHPLLDDLRLIETVLRLPPELAYDEDLDRPVLRQGMRGLVPEPIRLRKTKSFFDNVLVDSLAGPDRPQLRGLLEPQDAEIRAYVTDERIRDVVDGPVAPERPFLWAMNAWRLASTELWLRSLASRTDLANGLDGPVS